MKNFSSNLIVALLTFVIGIGLSPVWNNLTEPNCTGVLVYGLETKKLYCVSSTDSLKFNEGTVRIEGNKTEVYPKDY